MPFLDRRSFLKFMGAATATAAVPALMSRTAQGLTTDGVAMPKGFYDLPIKGNVRILHITDIHGQLNPVYFREPNVNLGVGEAYGRPPHLVGNKLLTAMGFKPATAESYVYTYLDFENAARTFGKTGGYAHIKTLLDRLRSNAGGKQNTITLDGGDLWQGSGTALWTRGVDMVEASNILGLDVMVGHWEFTYKENEVLSNVALFKGDFIGQNVRVKEASLFGDEYPKLVEKYDGSGYQSGLKGNDIPLVARIFSIADVFDALTTKRPYKKAFDFENAIEIILAKSGSHFDPTLVDVFHNISKDIFAEISAADDLTLEHILANSMIGRAHV